MAEFTWRGWATRTFEEARRLADDRLRNRHHDEYERLLFEETERLLVASMSARSAEPSCSHEEVFESRYADVCRGCGGLLRWENPLDDATPHEVKRLAEAIG